MDWPNWITIPVLAFYAVPFWLRVTLAIVVMGLSGAGIYRLVSA